MPIKAAIANVAWGAASLGAWQRFRRALRDPVATQERILRRCLRDNANTVAGRIYGFAGIASIEEYQSRVPISTFDTVAPFVHRISCGEPNVLTSRPVHRLVPSSGSTAAVKLIPYTTALQKEFSNAVDAWIADLYLRTPDLALGPSYWCITPATTNERPFANAQSTVPVGFDDDSAYLGGIKGALARAVMAVPPTVRLNRDLTAFRHATLSSLLRARDLRLISVWHPSFLSGLLDTLQQDWAVLLDGVARLDAARARELRPVAPDQITAIWPHLRVISCWGDGPARSHAADLAARTRGIVLQPKGLLATEGIVTIPFAGRHPVAITSHFFEFLPGGLGAGASGAQAARPMLAHQLIPGVEYTVVITTAGGLYRYHLADRVIVTDMIDRTPSLAFVGKDDRVSDLFGEKLSDGFVARVLETLFPGTQARPRFAMLAPEQLSMGVSYTLFVEEGPPRGGHDVLTEPGDLEARLEAGLRSNPHYAWCVDIGQLRPARVVRVKPGADRAYVNCCVAQGQRLGDVKPVSLHPRSGWEQVLPC